MNTLSTSVTIRVPFEDIDMFDIGWHGHFAKYFEVGRCALLDDIGYNYLDMRDAGYMYPVVDLHIKFSKPVQFGQSILVEATLVEWEQLLRFKYRIQDEVSSELIARGASTQAATQCGSMELLRSCPEVFAAKIEAAVNKVS